jgi:hypothetical protein
MRVGYGGWENIREMYNTFILYIMYEDEGGGGENIR